MLNLYTTNIETLSVHRVGNQSKGEPLFLSESPYALNDEIIGLLKEYFFKPFREKEENYFRFVHDADVEFNELYQLVTPIFEDESCIHQQSKKIAQHLYNQSNHPHIKSGEVYVALLHDTYLDNEKVKAVGIFKSEVKNSFFQFEEQPNQLEIIIQEGVNIQKLDKGCIIFNTNKEEGYKILSVDSNRYDTKYWLENFLNVDALIDDNFYTKKYLKFSQDFAKDVILPAEDKKEEVLFMNRAINYFAKNDDFEETSFVNEVFKHYKVEKGPKYQIEDVSSFPIANKAVSDVRKKIKNVIDLDTNIQIRMDFINPESADKFIEKGWDEEKQMYYYLVYFNKEQKNKE